MTVGNVKIGVTAVFGPSLKSEVAPGAQEGAPADFEVLDNDERQEVAEEAARDASVSNRYTRWSYLRRCRSCGNWWHRSAGYTKRCPASATEKSWRGKEWLDGTRPESVER